RSSSERYRPPNPLPSSASYGSDCTPRSHSFSRLPLKIFSFTSRSIVAAQAGAPKTLRPLAHPFPRIFFLLANVFLDHRGAEKFQRLKPRAIHCLGNSEHRPRSHPQRPETLLPVAQCSIDKMHFAHG